MMRRAEIDSGISRVSRGEQFCVNEFERTIRKIWVAMSDNDPARALAAVDFWFRVHKQKLSIEGLGVDEKTVSILEAAGVTQVQDLCELTRDQLVVIRQIGNRTVDMIEIALERNGLHLRKKQKLT